MSEVVSEVEASPEEKLARAIGECKRDPYKHVMRAYPWGEGALAGMNGPHPWQEDILREIGAGLQAGWGRATPVARHDRATGVARPQLQTSPRLPVRIAVASGHGIGKSALIAFLAHWAWSTLPGTRVVVTANTGTQLRTKTWPEIGKWYGQLLCRHWFTMGAESLQSRDPALRQTWRVDRVTWSEHNSEAFAGLHNRGKRIVVLFDEASSIADRIWDTTEGALTDSDTEIVWVAFGNPTRNTGRFRECWGRHRGLWTRRQIDSRTVPGTNAELAAQWVKSWGEESDFVRVRVKGEFPRAGSLQFIASDVVDAAMVRDIPQTYVQPLILGVDVARFGDDATVIQPRRGRDARSLPARRFRGLDTMQVAARVIEAAEELGADAVYVDEGGLGAGVVDRLRQLRCRGLQGVSFSGKADGWTAGGEGNARYANKRAEMWGALRDWLPGGAIAPPDSETGLDLKADLTGVEYGYNARDEILLESKADMKARGLSSPDTGDALALTFAHPVPMAAPERVMDNHTFDAMARLFGGGIYYQGERPYTPPDTSRPNMLPDDWEPYRNDDDDEY